MAGLITEGLGEDLVSGTDGFTCTGATASSNRVTLSFSPGLPPTSLTGPSADPTNWLFTEGSGAPITALAVAIVGITLVITTTPMTLGATYHLTIPAGMLSGGAGFLGPFVMDFTGAGSTPNLMQARADGARAVDVTFDSAADEGMALDVTRWSISPTLAVLSVRKITAQTYQLITDHQVNGTVYTITWPTH